MGTPILNENLERYPCDFSFKTNCDNCMKFTEADIQCKNNHHFCEDCNDIFCPLCTSLLCSPDYQSTYSIKPSHSPYKLVGAFFVLEIVFVGGYLLNIWVLSASRNCRLQGTWANAVFDIPIFRGRTRYNGIPTNVLPRRAGENLIIKHVPPNLYAPKLKGTLCSWRFYLEMYPFVLDRPEVSRLQLLPDTIDLFLEQFFQCPQKQVQIWQFNHKFPKYGCFFFASHGRSVICVQCGTNFKCVEDLSKKCLGGPNLVSLCDLYAALPVNVVVENGKIIKHAMRLSDSITTFADYWNKPVKPNPIQTTDHKPLSMLCTIKMHPVNALSVGKYVDRLFNAPNFKTGRRIDKFLCYNCKYNQDGFVIELECWLCRPITYNIPDNVQISMGLDNFESLMYLSLHKHISRVGQTEITLWGKTSQWNSIYAGWTQDK